MSSKNILKRLYAQNGGWASDEALDAAHRIEELEAKLAKAMDLAEKSMKWLRLYGADVHREAATLAELKGDTDE